MVKLLGVVVDCEPNIGSVLLVDVPKSDGFGASCEPVVVVLVPRPPKMLVLVDKVEEVDAAGTLISAGLVWLPKPPKKEVDVVVVAAGAADDAPKRLGTAGVVVVAVVVALLVDVLAPPKNDKDGVAWKLTLGAVWPVKLNLAAGSAGFSVDSAGLLGVAPKVNGNVEVVVIEAVVDAVEPKEEPNMSFGGSAGLLSWLTGLAEKSSVVVETIEAVPVVLLEPKRLEPVVTGAAAEAVLWPKDGGAEELDPNLNNEAGAVVSCAADGFSVVVAEPPKLNLISPGLAADEAPKRPPILLELDELVLRDEVPKDIGPEKDDEPVVPNLMVD